MTIQEVPQFDAVNSVAPVWVKGDFSGVLTGCQVRSHGMSTSYQLLVTEAEITNISKIPEPPINLSEPVPIRQIVVKNVHIASGGNVYELDIYDFILLDWSIDSTSINHGSGVFSERATGTAYFSLKKPAIKSLLGKANPVAKTLAQTPDTPVVTPVSVVPPVSTDLQTSKASKSLFCSSPFRIVMSLLLGIFLHPILAVGFFVVTLILCWISNFNFSSSRNKLKMPEIEPLVDGQNPVTQTVEQPSKTPDVPPVLAMPQTPKVLHCLPCSYLLRIILSLLVWCVCDAKLAAEFFAVTLIPCWLADFGCTSLRNKWIAFAVLFTLSAFGIWMLSRAECGNQQFWPLGLAALAMVWSFLVKNCKGRLLLTAMWLIAVLVFCGNKMGGCGFSKSSWYFPLAMQLMVSMDKVIHFNQLDPAESSQNLSASSNGAHRISINQALAHLEQAKDCDNSIYFPEASLFDINQSVIKPGAERSLNKLALLLSKFPDSHVKIIGHSDQSGEGTPDGAVYNYQLSEQRAAAVVQWLQQHKLSTENAEVIGMGAQFPIIEKPQNPEQLAENRRVEIEFPCSRTK